jgi:hypothetical protein
MRSRQLAGVYSARPKNKKELDMGGPAGSRRGIPADQMGGCFVPMVILFIVVLIVVF